MTSRSKQHDIHGEHNFDKFVSDSLIEDTKTSSATPTATAYKDAILITGAFGFLGSHIVRAAHKAFPEHYIIAIDKSLCSAKRWQGFTHEYGSSASCYTIDITDSKAISDFMYGIGKLVAVIHTAGVVPTASQHYDTSKKEYDRCHAVNVIGAGNVLEAAKQAGVRAFVYTSSVTVLVDDPTIDHRNMNEDTPIGGTTLPYAHSKTIAETMVLDANRKDFKTCSLRPSVLFGPGDTNCIPTLYSCIAKGETPWVIGNPLDTLYDFAYVTNVADAHMLALQNLLSSKPTAAGRPFFITNGEPMPFRTFCLAVWAGFGHVPKFEVHIPVVLAWFLGLLMEVITWVFGGEATLSRGSVKELTMDAYCDIQQAREVLGYKPKIGLREGIRLSCEDHVRELKVESKKG
jgi:sterol-4alpha-carboxylate 3-dehydrogenase (decarboxylating)